MSELTPQEIENLESFRATYQLSSFSPSTSKVHLYKDDCWFDLAKTKGGYWIAAFSTDDGDIISDCCPEPHPCDAAKNLQMKVIAEAEKISSEIDELEEAKRRIEKKIERLTKEHEHAHQKVRDMDDFVRYMLDSDDEGIEVGEKW